MKILVVFGTRPEAIKLSSVIHLLKDKFDVKILSSGQHLELTNQAINFFGIKLDYNLACMPKKPDLMVVYEKIILKMKRIIDKENPDLLIVQGDTLSTYSGAFLGFMFKKPVLHVEAGLRTFNNFSPFPEEMLRLLVSRLACFHFVPTKRSAENLIAEGIKKDKIFISGNTVVDSLLYTKKNINEKTVFEELAKTNQGIEKKIHSKKLILITSHRRENIGEPLRNICRAVKQLADKYKDAFFLWSLHKNPDIRKIVLDEISGNSDNIILSESFSYQTLIYLMENSHIIMTDSGGIQEEAPTFHRPLIILRESTERQEVVEKGIGFLTACNIDKTVNIFTSLYEDKEFYSNISKKSNPFGDGKASKRILDFLLLDEVKSFIKNYPASSEQILNVKGKVDEFKE